MSYPPNSSRDGLEAFVRRAAASVPPESMVLDAGAGRARYAPLFAAHRYETADFSAVTDQTYVCDLADIPVHDHRYDLVLCSQVLEHVPDPSGVLAEIHRILKPDGLLFLSAPLFYEEHDQPYDFFRYTQFALRRLLAGAGLVVESIDWLEGYLGTLGYQARMAGRELPTDSRSYGGGLRGGTARFAAMGARPVLRRLGWWLNECDRRYQVTNSGMPKNYAVVARAPSQTSSTAS